MNINNVVKEDIDRDSTQVESDNNEDAADDLAEHDTLDTEEPLQDDINDPPVEVHNTYRRQQSDVYMKQLPPLLENRDSAIRGDEEQSYKFETVDQSEEKRETEKTTEARSK